MEIVSGEDVLVGGKEFCGIDESAMLGHCVHRLLEHSAKRHWERTAVICLERKLTYRQVHMLANHLARVLASRGVRRGDLVAVAVERSANVVIALLAVLKAGAAFVPMDPTFPARRISQMMEDAAPSLVVASASTIAVFSAWQDVCLLVDEALKDDDINGETLQVETRPEDLVFIMYTSGSTGRPKGVEMGHGALANLLLSLQREPGCDETDRMLAVSTISFDMAFLEIFLPLLCGAAVVMTEAQQTRDPRALVGLMKRHAITMMQATPAAWQMLLDSGWSGEPRLRSMLSTAEALPRRLAERLLDCGDELWNVYGPTETEIATVWKVRRGEEIVVGGAICNSRLYVLDDNMAPVALGSAGELYIGGAGVARGYRNNAELTRSRFLDDPFHPGGRVYRTGDLARFVAPNKLSILGRMDAQIKVRGYRIEPGDVEAAITDHKSVSGAVVIGRDKRLIAYIVRDRTRDKGPDGPLHTVLRPWLTERLPAYMMPCLFIELEALPLTPNGKVDRRALPDPAGVSRESRVVELPTSELEHRILAIWTQVLGHEDISVDDSFFEVGGDSARLIQVQQELEKLLNQILSTVELFEHFTIGKLAAHLTSARTNGLKGTPRKRQGGASDEDIAIVSTACRLPGGVETPEQFWDLLQKGADVIKHVPSDRWSADALYDADPDARGKSYCCTGGFLDSATCNSFDAHFFGISPREARALDPIQWIVLETCWEAFERAGYTSNQLRGSQTGVFIGTSNIAAYERVASGDAAGLDGYAATGTAAATLSGRVSYILGLEGPAMTVDTACSSSLVAIHLACSALRLGECDVAVSCGASLVLNPGLYIEFSRLRGVSPDGRCRAFAADAQGTGWGEGSAAIVLKRLSDAQRDGDAIHAVIRGTAMNHDGRSAGLTVPSGTSQQRLIRTCLSVAGLQPQDIDYIEAHGTGTKLGDPIEAAALADVFGHCRSEAHLPLYVGSAKSNLGHTQAAAGLVGLLKVILALQHESLPQTLHVSEPTPAVDWKCARMALVLEKQPWACKAHRPRRAGVSAFGIGGTNAHVVVQEAPRLINGDMEAPRRLNGDDGLPGDRNGVDDGTEAMNRDENATLLPASLPFLLSGVSDASLRAQAEKLRKYIEAKRPGSLGDIAYSLATSRNHFRRRLAVLAGNQAELLEKLAAVAQSPTLAAKDQTIATSAPKIAMLFTGQGSQRLGMGKQLSAVYPVFRDAIAEITAHFSNLERPLLNVMWAEAGSSDAAFLSRTDFAQPALFALEVALWRLWQSWGVCPDLVLGHSVGEIAAAHVAGVMDLDDACRLVAARGQLMQALPTSCGGAMASLEAGADEIAAAVKTLGLDAQLGIAGYNTPTQTVVSGDGPAVQQVIHYLLARGQRRHKRLDVSHAFHSHHMESILAPLSKVAESLSLRPPKLAIISSLSGRMAEPGQLSQASYWAQQARQAVRFCDGMQALASHGANVFVEVGPHPVLCGMGAACLGDASSKAWLPSLAAGKDEALVVQTSLADLHIRHVDLDWLAYFGPFGCRRVELPTYAFQRERVRPDNKLALWAPGLTSVDGAGSTASKSDFEIAWHPAATDHAQPSGKWGLLLVAQDAAWEAEITTALSRASGIQLVPVERLEDAQHLDGLLCLWESDANLDSATDVVFRAHDYTMRGLTQLQTAASMPFAPPLVWVTRNAVSVGAHDGASGLGAAPLWGLMRTGRNELAELRLRLLDVGQDSAPAALVSALMLSAEPECAVRQKQVLVPRLQCLEQASPAKRPLLRTDGAVLITGGVGGLGSQVARRLASAHGVCDLVLISRHGMAAPGAQDLLTELSGLGAKATVVAGDVAHFNSIKSIITTMFGPQRPLRGVVHAAGVSGAGIVSHLTSQQCRVVLAPKVDGSWNLHQLTRDMDLDLFAMFSSIASAWGMPGLANYSAANAFLDALASLRHAQHVPATSVAFGTWAGGGMASRMAATTETHLANFGVDVLQPGDGLDSLEQAIRSRRALTVAAMVDSKRLARYFTTQGGIPPFYRSFLGELQVEEKPLFDKDLRSKIAHAAPEQQAHLLLRVVRETVAQELGFSRPDLVDVDLPLQELGIDSLTAVLTRNHLAARTGLALTTNVILLQPSLRALGQALLHQLIRDEVGDALPQHSAPRLDVAAVLRGCLDADLCFDNSAASMPGRPESVLVTGATGFIGAFIVHELLQKGIVAHCLVRANSHDEGRCRLETTLEDYGLWRPDYASLLQPVVGDITQPLLGLSEAAFNALADGVDAICHSGALVDWMRPLNDYIGPNVISTHEVLRLASRGRAKALHLVSTIATLPLHRGFASVEDGPEYGYGTSKYIAERLVSAARWRGARASIYRLPLVTASAATGHFRLRRGDFLHMLLAGSLELGVFPSLDANLSAVLPVDYLSETITAMMTRDLRRIGRDFDFANPRAPPFNQFAALMGAVKVLPFSVWHQRVLDYAAAHPEAPLARITAVLDGYSDQTAPTMVQGYPGGEHILGGQDDYPAPPVDEQTVLRYRDRITVASLA
ncbi:hypothetical protein CDD81_2029 [Ophiocordyceps australis]|uniref:Carrier domain-containing protein n=1 Tax=Ophiocordyceps australis TaxID=1399860 RepID=A0A2C5YF40_9HYPO|nr:hypothetical protein CDD81_2029 [Ophiocordyceps australis]